MTYRDNSYYPEQRCKDILAEIEVLERREREYRCLVWNRHELMRELEVVSNGRYQAPRGETLMTSLRMAANAIATVVLAVLVALMTLAVSLKVIGPYVQNPGVPATTGLQPDPPANVVTADHRSTSCF